MTHPAWFFFLIAGDFVLLGSHYLLRRCFDYSNCLDSEKRIRYCSNGLGCRLDSRNDCCVHRTSRVLHVIRNLHLQILLPEATCAGKRFLSSMGGEYIRLNLKVSVVFSPMIDTPDSDHLRLRLSLHRLPGWDCRLWLL